MLTQKEPCGHAANVRYVSAKAHCKTNIPVEHVWPSWEGVMGFYISPNCSAASRRVVAQPINLKFDRISKQSSSGTLAIRRGKLMQST